MEMKHLYRLCLFIVLFVFFIHIIDTADFAVFTKEISLNNLKCDTQYEEFLFLTPRLDGCVSRCLKHVKCQTVFYDTSQMWCQGCTSKDNTISASGTVGFSTGRYGTI